MATTTRPSGRHHPAHNTNVRHDGGVAQTHADRLATAMSSTQDTNASICHILREDPDLAEGLQPRQRQRAIAECIASTTRIPPGAWKGIQAIDLTGGVGLLVLDGLLLRRVGVDGRYGGELLGTGDLLRPWQGEDTHPAIPRTTGWRVLRPTRVAVLDRVAAHRMAQFPELTGRLVERALERSRNLSVVIAIVHQPRVEIRLQMLFWHLAERWGQVRPDGVALPLHITHNLLADLVAARRPTVTTAMSELTRRRLIVPIKDGWALPGTPPRALLELRDAEALATAGPDAE
jgi:CRP/FNR family transcriptional regulator, cyclic AMP receptor protein